LTSEFRRDIGTEPGTGKASRQCLVQDHGLERNEAERADEERKTKLGSPEPDQSARRAGEGASEKGNPQVGVRRSGLGGDRSSA
jgi:hypothetical protein